MIAQQHRVKQYDQPYLRLGRTVLSGPGEIVVSFRVPFGLLVISAGGL